MGQGEAVQAILEGPVPRDCPALGRVHLRVPSLTRCRGPVGSGWPGSGASRVPSALEPSESACAHRSLPPAPHPAPVLTAVRGGCLLSGPRPESLADSEEVAQLSPLTPPACRAPAFLRQEQEATSAGPLPSSPTSPALSLPRWQP
uniref:Uncharacterized protein n=1 Tax=Myotis myotis TaxID=51298 RepID=A0A7J7UPH0_MYOMY|nr:hypothetical protein mMyoMyo1_008561 [Myotis myotis]